MMDWQVKNCHFRARHIRRYVERGKAILDRQGATQNAGFVLGLLYHIKRQWRQIIDEYF